MTCQSGWTRVVGESKSVALDHRAYWFPSGLTSTAVAGIDR
jgi:hypothetical protein